MQFNFPLKTDLHNRSQRVSPYTSPPLCQWDGPLLCGEPRAFT